MIIRDMAVSDIPVICEMARNEAGFRVAESEQSCFWSKSQLERWVTSGEDVLLIAEDNEKLAGFILTTLHRPTGKATWENQLVLPEYRGKGIAKALVEEMKARLKAKGATYLHFLVKISNESIGFYEKIGFEKGYDFSWFGMNL